MKVVVLKGGDEAVPLPQSVRAPHGPSRNAGAAALSGDGRHWALLNISPAVAHQLSSDARLLRHPALVSAPARVLVLTDAQVDHVTGLLSLRDGAPIHLYATPAVFEELTHALPVLPMLENYCGVHWHVIPVAGECRTAVFRVEGQPGLEFTAVATDGPRPLHAVNAAHAEPLTGESIALAVRDVATGRRLFFAGGVAGAGVDALEWMEDADCVLVGCDTGPSPASRPGAWAQGSSTHARTGASGGDEPASWDVLQAISARRRLLMCHPDRPGRHCPSAQTLQDWGIELPEDRCEISL